MMKEQKQPLRSMSRPRIYDDRTRICIVLNKDEEIAIKDRAYSSGSDLSRYVRSLILENLKEAA